MYVRVVKDEMEGLRRRPGEEVGVDEGHVGRRRRPLTSMDQPVLALNNAVGTRARTARIVT
jgi:hypothetical protein